MNYYLQSRNRQAQHTLHTQITFGPSVIPTTVASLSTPACILLSASPFLLKWSCLAAAVMVSPPRLHTVTAQQPSKEQLKRKQIISYLKLERLHCCRELRLKGHPVHRQCSGNFLAEMKPEPSRSIDLYAPVKHKSPINKRYQPETHRL